MEQPTSLRKQRQHGALLGLAVGDALGAAVEFCPPGSFPAVTGFRAGGPHGLAPGEWTDDTSMALALADSLVNVGWNLEDQAQRYVAWWKRGEYSVNGTCFDIGITTRAALGRISKHGAAAHSAGDTSDAASGNGSIMRLAPVPIRYLAMFPGNVTKLADLAEQSSYPTHRSAKCLSACRYLAVVLAALMQGRPRDEVLAPDWPVLRALHGAKPLDSAILDVAQGSFRTKQPPHIKGSGYVVESLEAALWAFHRAQSFREAVLAAVNLGDDADTTGAICGQLAGAYFGAGDIPAEWLAQLAQTQQLLATASKLCEPHGSLADDHSVEPPLQRSYWVIPGRLLAGAYPGHPDPATHAHKQDALWNAGIRSVVSLMGEDERDHQQRKLADYVAPLRERAADAGQAFRFRRFPIVDISTPTPETMQQLLDHIDAELLAERPVYIHCFGGFGRTGTAVGCWLLRHGYASQADVLTVLDGLRRRDPDKQAAAKPSPETQAQRRFVTEWLHNPVRVE